ncbi:Fic family protein [Helicobacter pylori]|uniref:Fic family protein n=1 Tax=Helicobacter pylori TaxID=210 RepID=UPI000FDD312A|nr:Fic family protein [Helicobacter pylori]RVZ09143.1 Fic family protein [Helicobacter pylori]
MDYKELLEFDDYAMDLTIRMAYHNSAMEGNNLTLGDTMSILIDRKTPIKSVSLDEVHEIENYRNFVPLILEFLERDKIIDKHLIGHFHSVLMRNILPDFGKFKTTYNEIIGAKKPTASPIMVQPRINNLCLKIQDEALLNLSGEEKIKKIAEHHIEFEEIHPFSDGNGRVGRLVMFKECLKNNIMPFIIENEHKAFYYKGIKEYDNTKGYLKDTILQSQDNFNEMVSYFFCE